MYTLTIIKVFSKLIHQQREKINIFTTHPILGVTWTFIRFELFAIVCQRCFFW